MATCQLRVAGSSTPRARCSRRSALTAIDAEAPLQTHMSHPANPNQNLAEQRRPLELGLLIFRQLLPVLGVFVLGWPQFTAALFYIFEVWLFLVGRRTVELALDPERRRREPGFFAACRDVLAFGVVAGVLFAVFAGMSLFVLAEGFLETEWHELADGGWRDPGLLTSLVFVIVEAARDLYRFKSTLGNRSKEQIQHDDRMLISRTLALWGCAFVVIIGHWVGAAGYVQVLAMSLGMLWLEWPAQATSPAPAA